MKAPKPSLSAMVSRPCNICACRARHFDAVLMDIQMPVMDGLAATRAIREQLGLADLPIIALTAGVLTEQRRQALEAGANDFLAKPVDLGELVAALLRSVGNRFCVAPDPPAPADSRECLGDDRGDR